jgi:formate dehydrogenase (coenzyme F420) beta subunit
MMVRYTEKVREAAGKLLESGTVEVFIGYRRGTVPLMNEPLQVTDSDRVDELYWDCNCGLNLCNYLTKRPEKKIGIVANGCNSRNMVTHILENQITREQLYIVGIPCEGMIDHRAVQRKVNGRDIMDYREEGGEIVVSGRDFEEKIKKADVLRTNCSICRHRNPVIYDELLGEKVEELTDVDCYKDVRHIEEMPPEKKQKFFEQLISNCLRCYACRNACPLCYCPTCFVDESKPQWVGKSVDPTDTLTFHFLRAYH